MAAEELSRELFLSRMRELDVVTEALCEPSALSPMLDFKACHNTGMPSYAALKELMTRLKALLFPGYFGPSKVYRESLRYHIAANLDSIFRLLAEQIQRGGCFACADYINDCRGSDVASGELAMRFMQHLPDIRVKLISDAQAAYDGDPAATSPGETVYCYPSMQAMIHHRVAHELYALKVPVIPRIIAEMAHARTGIDIHPGASIGKSFFVDHGTGVVIGETCIIGQNCRLYQGVTLGAFSFSKNADGTLVKGIPRHPILEDNVTVYAGASILGRITIGSGSVIGGNVWLTHSVPSGSRIVQSGPKAKPGEPLTGNPPAKRAD